MPARDVESQVLKRLGQFPCVALLGPRRVGKTTLARSIVERRPESAIYLDLEDPAHRRRLDDAPAYLAAQSDKPVVLDEIHRVPALFEVLRGQIDERRRAGRQAGHFLTLGSAALDLLRQSSKSLAGRIVHVERRRAPFAPSGSPSPVKNGGG
jgi:predicted AAA+ superfamily ATPase